MTFEQALSLTGFILAMVGTPGPNNLMLVASGVKFGIRRSIPHLLGIACGCQLLIVATAFGVGQLMELVPGLTLALHIFSALFLFYLAWKLLAASAGASTGAEFARPIGFWQAVLFQWVNPKAWMISLALVSTYIDPTRMLETTAWVALYFLLIGTPLLVMWNASGVVLKNWLGEGRRLLYFNRMMVVLLIASLYPMISS